MPAPKVALPRSSYAGSVTAAFFVILIVYLAKNNLVSRMIDWIGSPPGSGSTAMTVVAAPSPPSTGTTTSSGVGQGVTGR